MTKIILTVTLPIFWNVAIIAQNRIVLIEAFTNSGCPACAIYQPALTDYVDNNLTKVVAIEYHPKFPYKDSMYFENKTDNDARVAFYSISGVPRSQVDGNYQNVTANLSAIQTQVNKRSAMASQYDIKELNNVVSGNTLNTKIVFQSLTGSNANDNISATIVVIEKLVLKSSYKPSTGFNSNSETEYKYVMRKMLPTASGSVLKNKNLSGQDTLSFAWNLSNIKTIDEIRIVAFVQNTTTKEVYQAAMFTPSIDNITASINEKDNRFSPIMIYPNPAVNVLNIDVGENGRNDFITITDVIGKIVSTYQVNGQKHIEISTKELQAGLYFLTYSNDTHKISKKIIIQK